MSPSAVAVREGGMFVSFLPILRDFGRTAAGDEAVGEDCGSGGGVQ